MVRVHGSATGPYRLRERMAHYRVPAVSLAITEGDEIAWARAYGLADTTLGTSASERTLFQAASISKPVSAVAVLRLVERRLIDLDRDVDSYLRSWKLPRNEFTREREVTLRHLLSHTAGTTVSGFPGYARGAPLPTTRQILDGEAPANTPPVRVDSPVGITFRYSGGGTTIVQQLLAGATARRARRSRVHARRHRRTPPLRAFGRATRLYLSARRLRGRRARCSGDDERLRGRRDLARRRGPQRDRLDVRMAGLREARARHCAGRRITSLALRR